MDSLPFNRQNFVIEDPYDARNTFKVTDNLDMMHSNRYADPEVNEVKKLDIIFGNYSVNTVF